MSRSAEIIAREIALLPHLLQEPSGHFFERLDKPGSLQGIDIEALVRLVSSSEFAAKTLLRERDWFFDSCRSGTLRRTMLADQCAEFGLGAEQSGDDLARLLRQFRNRQLLAILWRELAGDCTVADTLADLSTVADTLIRASTHVAMTELEQRFGKVRNRDGTQSEFVILAMGKLGGSELNFSSDIDLVFLYTIDGTSDGPRQLSAQEFFGRLARKIVMLLDQVTPDGFVYRVDTRLRPFGESGPPVVSFAALESYLVQHGRSWERYAYVKARVVFGDADAAQDLQRNLIEPFVYRRYLDYGVFESLRKMKSLIEAEVTRRELADNIKLGPGGIREIEFIVQSLQLVRAGNEPALRSTSLQTVLPRLRGHGGLDQQSVDDLLAAYSFLRRIENCLQAIRDQQTHDLPADQKDQLRVTVAMHYESWASLEQQLQRHRQTVSRIFSNVAFRTEGDPVAGDAAADRSEVIAALWDAAAAADVWATVLEEMGLQPALELARTMSRFSKLPGSRQIDSVARRRLVLLLPNLLTATASCADPDTTLRRILDIVSNILRRSAYVSLLNENPLVLQRLVELCATSAYLANEISRFPLLLDEMLDPRLHLVNPGKADMQRELDARLAHLDRTDSEAQINSLAQFQRATLFRIAVADFSGGLALMHVSDKLTELAEIVLNAALDVAWQDLVSRHGEPCYLDEGILRPAGFGVVAYGKLAGMEMSYSSDLDLVFLHDSTGGKQQTNGTTPLDNSMFFSRLVRRLVHFLTTQTSSGVLYEVDTRLRPSGRSGLLVTSVEAFERYQDENAWTWEHQALLRSRAVAGSAAVAREFERIRADTLRGRVHLDKLSADVNDMRAKMRGHLDNSDAGHFDIKQGDGGIGDIEFLVQYLVLKNAPQHAAVIHYPDNIRQLGTLGAADCLDDDEVARLQTVYQDYRQRLHGLALDGKGSLVGAGEFVDQRALVREIYAKFMSP